MEVINLVTTQYDPSGKDSEYPPCKIDFYVEIDPAGHYVSYKKKCDARYCLKTATRIGLIKFYGKKYLKAELCDNCLYEFVEEPGMFM